MCDYNFIRRRSNLSTTIYWLLIRWHINFNNKWDGIAPILLKGTKVERTRRMRLRRQVALQSNTINLRLRPVWSCRNSVSLMIISRRYAGRRRSKGWIRRRGSVRMCRAGWILSSRCHNPFGNPFPKGTYYARRTGPIVWASQRRLIEQLLGNKLLEPDRKHQEQYN